MLGLDWIAPIGTILGIELLRRKMWQGWAVGIVNQGIWTAMAIQNKTYGLLILTCVLTPQYAWGLYQWRREDMNKAHSSRE